jgi:hypothetical protein
VSAQRAQAEADAARIRAEAEAIKREAEAEAARVRADAEAARAAKTKADAEAAAARIRAKAEADAARIRTEAAAHPSGPTEASRGATAGTPAVSPATPLAPPIPATAPPASSKSSSETSSAASPGATTTAHDGQWKVAILCEAYGKATEGFATDLVVNVREGDLYGWRGVFGTPGAMRMEGTIAADGSARLVVRGRTADPKYEMKGNVPPGSPYRYEVRARFEGSSGTGTRADRPCEIRFARQ